ncbi:MAG: histidinol-phosphatase HisJ family protein [Clostridiales bacterium]|nr:histidinol-phosphatase HisJ family protein [Clostridiales bacterium]
MAILYDQHLHTALSPDGISPMEEYCSAALIRGMKGLCFTEHVDVLCSEVEFNPGTDLAAYKAAFDAVKEQHGHELDLHFGIEAGLISWSLAETAEYLKGYEFDYIIASYHYPEGIPNLMYPENWAFVSREVGLQKYLRGFLPCLKGYDDYDCIGHLTYFSRYCPLSPKRTTYADAPDEIDAIFRHLIEKGKGMEVNTSTYESCGFTMPDLTMVKRYRELGGEIITIGSDGHAVSHLGRSFAYACEMLKQAGFTHYAVFTGRKPTFLPL